MILRGTIFITDNEDVVYNANLQTTKIVSLDEDGVLMDNLALGGTCLLPPPEAKIAEADGNEQLYDMAYSSHLLEPFQQQFVAALLAYLYQGGNLILFLPELGYTYTEEKLVEHMWRIYGIHIGLIGAQDPNRANCYYDEKATPIWLNLIYLADVMDPKAYLYNYPLDAPLQNQAATSKLIDELKPYGKTYIEKVNTLERYKRLLRNNPKVNLVFHME